MISNKSTEVRRQDIEGAMVFHQATHQLPVPISAGLFILTDLVVTSKQVQWYQLWINNRRSAIDLFDQ
ncbi:hypothetical protein D3C77_552280 [compost metagenome]